MSGYRVRGASCRAHLLVLRASRPAHCPSSSPHTVQCRRTAAALRLRARGSAARMDRAEASSPLPPPPSCTSTTTTTWDSATPSPPLPPSTPNPLPLSRYTSLPPVSSKTPVTDARAFHSPLLSSTPTLPRTVSSLLSTQPPNRILPRPAPPATVKVRQPQVGAASAGGPSGDENAACTCLSLRATAAHAVEGDGGVGLRVPLLLTSTGSGTSKCGDVHRLHLRDSRASVPGNTGNAGRGSVGADSTRSHRLIGSFGSLRQRCSGDGVVDWGIRRIRGGGVRLYVQTPQASPLPQTPQNAHERIFQLPEAEMKR